MTKINYSEVMIVMEYSIQKLENSVVEIAIKVGKDKWNECISEAIKRQKDNIKFKVLDQEQSPF